MPTELTLLATSTILLFVHVMVQGQTATGIVLLTRTGYRSALPR